MVATFILFGVQTGAFDQYFISLRIKLIPFFISILGLSGFVQSLMLFEVFLAPSVKGKIIVELTIALSSDRNVYVHLEGLFFRKILILFPLLLKKVKLFFLTMKKM